MRLRYVCPRGNPSLAPTRTGSSSGASSGPHPWGESTEALRPEASSHLPLSHHPRAITYRQATHARPRAHSAATAAHTPGGFESLELLQKRGELLLLWRRQVSQSCLFPEHALRKLAAAEERAGVRQASPASARALLTSPAGRPVPADQLEKLLVLQLLVQGGRRQLLLLLQPLLVQVPLSEATASPGLCPSGSGPTAALCHAPASRPCSAQKGVHSPAVGEVMDQGRRVHDPTS